MKIYNGLLSLVAASLIMTGCSDKYTVESDNVNNDTGKYSVSGVVKGCVFETIGQSASGHANTMGVPVDGATVTVGTITAYTDSEGCYALNVSYTTSGSDHTGFHGELTVEKAGFNSAMMTFNTEHVVSGVMYDFGDNLLTRDTTAPFDEGIFNLAYEDSMLAKGIDGLAKPIQLKISETVELSSTIDTDTIVEVYDENKTKLNSSVTAIVTFDKNKNILSVNTSEAIDAGNYVRVLIPTDAVADAASNTIVSGTENTSVEVAGSSLMDYLTFLVRIFDEGDLDAKAVTGLTQMSDDAVIDSDDTLVYHASLTALETANPAFKNVVKHDENSGNAGAISHFNNDSNNRVQNLANAYIGGGVTVDPNVLRVKFTPSNAAYYVIKAYDENNVSISFNTLSDSLNADVSNVANGDTSVKLRVDSQTDDIEVALKLNSTANQELMIKITPYTLNGLAGTAIIKSVKDNVSPTASLQYSYDVSDGVVVSVSGGVQPVTEEIYGGSGEISNSTSAQADDNTTYSFGLPILNMTYNLLADKNATLDLGNTDLPSDYNASEYSAWKALNGTARSFGIGFTEPVTNVTVSAASEVTLTAEVNSTNLTSAYNSTTNEEVVIVTVSDVFAMVNDENGSKITLNVSDIAGNTATASVVLNDKVEPFIVSADLNVSKTITFSENIKDANTTISITGLGIVNVSDVNITTNTITLDNNESVLGLTRPYSIQYNGTDLNGNSSARTFRVD